VHMEDTMSDTELKLLFSKIESARALGISKRKIDLLIASKQLHAVHIGRRSMLHKRELERIARVGA